MIKTIEDVFVDFPFEITEREIIETVRGVKDSARRDWNTKDNLRLAFSCIDLTSLNATDTKTRIREFVGKVNNFPDHFPGMPNVAAICVYPNMIPVVKQSLKNYSVRVASVAGGFPHSMTFPEIKAGEAGLAVNAGADEVDIVISLSSFLDDGYQFCFDEIYMIKKAVGDAHLKIILETGVLADPERIWKASLIAMSAGADFIKTSTGKMDPAATLEAAYVMTRAIKSFHEKKRKKVGFKPAGGIVEACDALSYLGMVQTVLGEEWMNHEYFRIGASRLANNILSSVYGEPINYF